MTTTMRTRPNILSLSDAELRVLVEAASRIPSPADRVRLLEQVADALMAAPKIDPAAVAIAVRAALKRLAA
jgi:hypothetical protein